jgi:hypothetical protein
VKNEKYFCASACGSEAGGKEKCCSGFARDSESQTPCEISRCENAISCEIQSLGVTVWCREDSRCGAAAKAGEESSSQEDRAFFESFVFGKMRSQNCACEIVRRQNFDGAQQSCIQQSCIQ